MATPNELAATPKSAYISKVRSIAANKSWARTPNRSERTEAARKASPTSLAYWITKIRKEGKVREEDVLAAAQNAHRAHMSEMSLKAVAARRAKAGKTVGESAA
ncbi:hypothetical protein [Nonomuraea sp. NPDC049400]|uniref:hypothetical protein n=1 Tax=Nonomuraea sp. NPDC049400 TaxID=3364352 RepID=UPI003792F723